MKYAKELKAQLAEYGANIQGRCIDYRKWKKLIKTDNCLTANWQSMLMTDCLYVDSLLHGRMSCFWFNLEKDDVRTLSLINTNTLYKICKRLQRELNVPSMEYLNYIIRSHRFRFTKCSDETLI